MFYLVMGLLGLAILLVTLLFDGVFDVLHFDIFDSGILSMTGLASFVAFFGFTGYLCVASNQSATVTTVSTIAMGLLGLVSTGTAMRYMKKHSQDDNAFDNSNMVGRTAVVVSGGAAGEYGTVAVAWNGMTENIAALSTTELVKGDEVTITHVLSHSSVRVAKNVQDSPLPL